jgi:hypothetical protein
MSIWTVSLAAAAVVLFGSSSSSYSSVVVAAAAARLFKALAAQETSQGVKRPKCQTLGVCHEYQLI